MAHSSLFEEWDATPAQPMRSQPPPPPPAQPIRAPLAASYEPQPPPASFPQQFAQPPAPPLHQEQPLPPRQPHVVTPSIAPSSAASAQGEASLFTLSRADWPIADRRQFAQARSVCMVRWLLRTPRPWRGFLS
jgi:hypothetical protein